MYTQPKTIESEFKGPLISMYFTLFYNFNVFRFHGANTANIFQRIICESKKGSWVCAFCEGGKEERWSERWLPNLLALRPSWDMGSQWLPNEPLLPQRAHPTPPPGVPNIRMKDCTHSITITCVAFPARSGRAHENTIFIDATPTCSPLSHIVILHREVKHTRA